MLWRMSRTPTALTIITGHSRGLGEALARQCLQAGHLVIGIARHRHTGLDAEALRDEAPFQQWEHDLAEPQAAGWALLEWLQAQPADRFRHATLINNAGVLAPPRPLADSDPGDTARVLRVGLEAAMTLTGLFLRGTQDWSARRKVLNISSGLGRRAMAGSAAYCAAKAGLDHFTRAVALEQAALPNGARLVSMAPGVVDTDMQQQLRGADPAAFPDQGRFQALWDQGQLATPEATARQLLARLERSDFGSEPIGDVREG